MRWLDSYKRRLYLVMLLSGLLSSGFAWAINEYTDNISTFTRIMFATVVLSTATLALLTYSRPGTVLIVQEALYLIIGGVLLSVLIYALYANLEDRMQVVSLFSMFLCPLSADLRIPGLR